MLAALTPASTAEATRTPNSNYTQVRHAVYSVFGRHASAAMRVVACETGRTYSTWAKNGQYVNIFQMGYNERRTFGWHVAGSPAIVAARAAYRYFRYSGYSWRAWTCKPY